MADECNCGMNVTHWALQDKLKKHFEYIKSETYRGSEREMVKFVSRVLTGGKDAGR